ncbi:MAG: hypothetical protein WDO15_28405 [Bacteroidota bacterium]
MAGRGSFIESFPLFGYNLKDYDSLFAEKIELLIKTEAKARRSHGRESFVLRSMISVSIQGHYTKSFRYGLQSVEHRSRLPVPAV